MADRGHARPCAELSAVAIGPRLQGLPAVLTPSTRLLVLGSFPGAASLARHEYYGHPRNQFWPIVGAIWGLPLAGWAYDERIAELHRRGLGLWDVVASCRRQGSLDQAIEEPEYNDLAGLTRRAPALRAIACNGAVAAGAVRLAAPPGLPVQRLPSTSPAHASWSFERKLQAWRAMFLAAGV